MQNDSLSRIVHGRCRCCGSRSAMNYDQCAPFPELGCESSALQSKYVNLVDKSQPTGLGIDAG
jgi:hypothetical protein